MSPPTWQQKLSRLDFRWNAISVIKTLGVAATWLGPTAMGVAGFQGFTEGRWQTTTLVAGAAVTVAGHLVASGAKWVLARGKEGVDRTHSANVSAALRFLREDLETSNDAFQANLLRCMVDMAGRICARGTATLHACYLRRVENTLHVVAYSGFRDGKAPSATLMVDEVGGVGAVEACLEGALVHVADVAKVGLTDKNYRSLLCFPLMDGEHCVGVITLDSTLAGHFDHLLDELDTLLRPYVELLHAAESRRTRGLRRAS